MRAHRLDSVHVSESITLPLVGRQPRFPELPCCYCISMRQLCLGDFTSGTAAHRTEAAEGLPQQRPEAGAAAVLAHGLPDNLRIPDNVVRPAH